MSTGKAVGNWQLQIGTGNLQSTCTVNPIGDAIDIPLADAYVRLKPRGFASAS
jgi:hypothetical protein